MNSVEEKNNRAANNLLYLFFFKENIKKNMQMYSQKLQLQIILWQGEKFNNFLHIIQKNEIDFFLVLCTYVVCMCKRMLN